MWELLDACVAGPRLDSSPEGSARRKRAAQKFSEWRPAARWYDARCVSIWHHSRMLQRKPEMSMLDTTIFWALLYVAVDHARKAAY